MAKQGRSLFKSTSNTRYTDNTSGLITGATSQQQFVDTADSFLNIDDDKNANNGYMAIDANGLVSSVILDKTSLEEITVDITGLDTIDISSAIAPVINLISSNPSETIDFIINIPTDCIIELRPESGLDVTFNDASVNSGNLHLRAPSLICYGTKFGYLQLKTHSRIVGDLFEKEYIDQLN